MDVYCRWASTVVKYATPGVFCIYITGSYELPCTYLLIHVGTIPSKYNPNPHHQWVLCICTDSILSKIIGCPYPIGDLADYWLNIELEIDITFDVTQNPSPVTHRTEAP